MKLRAQVPTMTAMLCVGAFCAAGGTEAAGAAGGASAIRSPAGSPLSVQADSGAVAFQTDGCASRAGGPRCESASDPTELRSYSERSVPAFALQPGLRLLSDPRGRRLGSETTAGQVFSRLTACDESVPGRFLLAFATLSLRAELEKRMRAADLHKSMTDAAVLGELGKAKALVTRRGSRILLEVSKKQRALLSALKVPELT